MADRKRLTSPPLSAIEATLRHVGEEPARVLASVLASVPASLLANLLANLLASERRERARLFDELGRRARRGRGGEGMATRPCH